MIIRFINRSNGDWDWGGGKASAPLNGLTGPDLGEAPPHPHPLEAAWGCIVVGVQPRGCIVVGVPPGLPPPMQRPPRERPEEASGGLLATGRLSRCPIASLLAIAGAHTGEGAREPFKAIEAPFGGGHGALHPSLVGLASRHKPTAGQALRQAVGVPGPQRRRTG